jgi:hypothetical protein
MSDNPPQRRSAPLNDDYQLWESIVRAAGGRQDARDTLLPREAAMVHKVTLELTQETETTVSVTARPATGAKAQPIALPPGAGRVGSFLKSFFPRTYGRTFYPVVADAQREWYHQALADKKPSRWITVRMWLLIAGNAIRMVTEWLARVRR